MDITAINRSVEPLVATVPVAPVEHVAETRDIVQAVKARNTTERFGQDNELVLQMDRQARRMVIPVINSKTEEVLTQVPPASATPLELVHVLYRGAIGAVQDARHYLADGKIAERSPAISKAYATLFELAAALDPETGGELPGRLAALYDYLQRRLLEANLQQSDAPLGEVLSLLVTLADGCAEISKDAEPPPPPSNPWNQPALPEPACASGAGSWSL